MKKAALPLLMVIFLISAYAEINPKYYKQYQEQAPEYITMQVISVNKDWRFFSSRRTVIVEARVITVQRTHSGLKEDDSITIRYIHFTPSRGWAGPRPIPLLEEEKSYPAFLKKSGEKHYEPAARGYSFGPVLLDN
jgi:hypothetical protein